MNTLKEYIDKNYPSRHELVLSSAQAMHLVKSGNVVLSREMFKKHIRNALLLPESLNGTTVNIFLVKPDHGDRPVTYSPIDISATVSKADKDILLTIVDSEFRQTILREAANITT